MSTLRKMAEIPAGSWTKWLVVGFWVAVLAVASPLAIKLKGAEKNDTSQWVPAGAESTNVLDALAHLQSPNISTAIVVYNRASGVTAADRAKAAADARRFAAIQGAVPREVVGPVPSADGKAILACGRRPSRAPRRPSLSAASTRPESRTPRRWAWPWP